MRGSSRSSTSAWLPRPSETSVKHRWQEVPLTEGERQRGLSSPWRSRCKRCGLWRTEDVFRRRVYALPESLGFEFHVGRFGGCSITCQRGKPIAPESRKLSGRRGRARSSSERRSCRTLRGTSPKSRRQSDPTDRSRQPETGKRLRGLLSLQRPPSKVSTPQDEGDRGKVCRRGARTGRRG